MYPKHSLGTRNVRVAFTLIELLVVVGIIAVLIAIILPVLGKAREQANRIKCAANLRTMGQAMTMYTQQYRYYPGASIWVTGAVEAGAVAAWPPRLRAFMGGNRDAFHCPSRDDSFRWGDREPTPLIQAAGIQLATVGYHPGEALVHYKAPFSYGYNATGTSVDKGLGQWVGRDAVAANRIRQPADMIAIADSNSGGAHIIKPSYEPAWPGRVHSGGANVLFCDGHVTWYVQQELVNNDKNMNTVGKWNLIARMWNNDRSAGTHTP